MAVYVEKNAQGETLFTLETKTSTYQMKADTYGYLLHLYYGDRIGQEDTGYLLHREDRGLCACPNDLGRDRTYSLDCQPQEYPAAGAGDFRTPCIGAEFENGGKTLDLRYASHRMLEKKPGLQGLPALYETKENGAETLEICLKDSAEDLCVYLLYSVFEKEDAIVRSCRVENRTGKTVFLNAVLSACMDINDDEELDLISFWGRHCMERNVERRPVAHGKTVIDSIRGTSSAQENPFVILCDHNATEDFGRCWGLSFVYSGNFAAVAEKNQLSLTRFTMGLNPENFRWRLLDGESFQAPEAVFCYSPAGLTALSQKYHRLYRENLCRGYWKDRRRPVLINNWEATYFHFDTEKLVKIAETASKLGVELLVMDDGWFGKRDDDWSGLGDWKVNEKKLPGGMKALCEKVNALGMKLGVWFEPEMVSEDSDLFRAHPDWFLHVPGRGYSRSRYQLVLDFSRKEVRENIHDQMAAVLSSANIEYVKWDMNRHLTEVWSAGLSPERQGEVCHRYMLGVYELMERLTGEFPHVLFEGCSSGGGRFDAGMLYYMPQSWCSDNTDAIERLEIQYGTSFGYPMSSVGAHVSASPNHQTGRTTPFYTRGVVAMAGTFGYELDLNTLTDEERDMVREQVAFYKKNYDTINRGEYYRLTDPTKNREFCAWEYVSPDKKKALLFGVITHVRCNVAMPVIRLKGLDPALEYKLSCKAEGRGGAEQAAAAMEGIYSGRLLMGAGLRIPNLRGDWPAFCVEIEQISR